MHAVVQGVNKNQEILKFGWSEQTCFSLVHGWGPHHPCIPQNNSNSVPKWTQLGIVQIGILSIHCILVLGTLVIVDHAYITKPPPHALLPSTGHWKSDWVNIDKWWNERPKNSIVVHVQKTNHRVNWEGATVQRESRWVLVENCAIHSDQKSHPEHEPGQWSSPAHGLECHPQTTIPHTT